MNSLWKKSVGAIVLGILLNACGSGGGDSASNGPPPAPPQNGLQSTPADKLVPTKVSCDDVRDYVAESIANLLLDDNVYTACSDCLATTDPSAGFGAADSAAGAAFFESVTGSNNQEAGVDELDQVAADLNGNIFTLDGQHLVVANGLPPENLVEVGNLKLSDNGYPEGLLYDPQSSRVVIAMSGFSPFEVAGLSLTAPISYATVELLFVDVSDPSNPIIDRRLMVEGFRLAARKIDDRVHLVSHFSPGLPREIFESQELNELLEDYTALPQDDPAREAIATDIRGLVSDLLSQIQGQSFLPRVWTANAADPYSDISVDDCSDVALPEVSLSFALTTVVSADIDGANVGTLSVANNAWNVYASQENIYLMQTSGGWWFSPRQKQETAIFQIAVGSNAPSYQAMGVVNGWAGSSFNFSEHEGYLRVASNIWEQDPATDVWDRSNSLFVLQNNNAGTLTQVGAVEGFGLNEQIFSARFIGDKGFVVTFRQIDPLFAFDLSNPENPQLMGELEIPGVSTYIHPLGEDHLLTIGLNGDDEGLDGRIQLQIFDVTDLANPQRAHSYVPEFNAVSGFTWSSAVHDHLTFNYFSEGGTVTIPIQYWADELDDHFSGFAAFSVDINDGFSELGRIDHSDLARDTYCADGTLLDLVSCVSALYIESANPKRAVSALYQGIPYIYTVSDVGIKVSLAQDFSNPVATLALPYTNSYWWLGY